MAEIDTVSGQRVVDLLQGAQEQNALLTMAVKDVGFEGLTVITEVGKVRRRWIMKVDPPKGFDPFVEGLSGRTIGFSFRGTDLVEYTFSVTEGVLEGSSIRFPLPEVMERQQRRSDFRMETPPATTLQFKFKDEDVVLDLINISLSGTLGALAKPRKIDPNAPPFKTGDTLTQLHILLPADESGEQPRVEVKRAVVRRIEHEADRNLIRYAFEFLNMNPTDERQLVQFIYQLQRQYLRRNITSR